MNNGIYKLSDDGKTLLYVTDKNISEAVIPDGVTHIEENAFLWCEALQSIDIPNSVTHIGNGAFQECRELQSINIPNSVTHIGDRAFSGCDALRSIDIPNSVTHIGNSTFSACYKLQSIEVAEENPYFTSIDGVLFNKDLTQIIRYPEAKNGNQYIIPDSVTHIGNDAFFKCEAIQNINIPNSVTHIGNRAFWCQSLQSIEVAEDNQYFASIDGVLFSKDLTQIIRYPRAKNGNQYTIPNSITHIGDSAFYWCGALQNINIPNSVTHIGNEAFYWCVALQSIDIPNSVTYIGNSAFSSCSSLQSIDIPNSVTHIGDKAFSYCKTLQSIEIPNSITHIGDEAFYYCEALQSIDIPDSVTHIGYEAFCGCEALQSIHIRITDIDSCCVKESAFYDIDFDNCILYIPSETRWAYRHHPVFRSFKNIEIDG